MGYITDCTNTQVVRSHVTGRLRITLLFLIVFAVSAAIRAPLSIRHTRLTPDAIAYYNIATNTAKVHCFISTLKLRCSDETSVVHPAIKDWPPLYPLFAGVIVRFGGDVRTLQIVNALLISIAAGLVFLIGTILFDWRAGLIAGLAAAIAPNLSRAAGIALSDSLSLALVLSAIALYLCDRRLPGALTVGLLCALATLTRYPNAIVAGVIIISSLLSPKRRKYGMACAALFASIVGLVFILQMATPGSPQTQALHYCVRSFHESMWTAHIQLDPLYALHHPLTVLTGVASNSALYALDLLIGLRGLFLLVVGLAVIRRRQLGSDRKLILAIAALSFCVYALTWSIPAVRGSRFMLLPYSLLLPFCASGLCKYLRKDGIRKSIAAVLCAATMGVYIWGTLTAFAFRGQEFPLPPDPIAAIVRHLPMGTCIATNNPWVVSYSTGVPTALLPRDLNHREFTRFVRNLNIGEVVLIGQHPRSQTATVLRGCCRNVIINKSVRIAIVASPLYGQNAYDGTWNVMPHIVQKLPSIHSPSMIPRKNGSALR